MDKAEIPRRDRDHLEVFGGSFSSREEAESFLALEDGIPRRFLRELYLREEFSGRVEMRCNV